MSTTPRSTLKNLLVIYLILSPIYMGYATYNWVSYKNEVASWKQAVDNDLQKELDAFVRDSKKK
jgi:hypothetical protein